MCSSSPATAWPTCSTFTAASRWGCWAGQQKVGSLRLDQWLRCQATSRLLHGPGDHCAASCPRDIKLNLVLQADKRFQLADWRARPLNDEMLAYARADTHYLLYCYDKLKASQLP